MGLVSAIFNFFIKERTGNACRKEKNFVMESEKKCITALPRVIRKDVFCDKQKEENLLINPGREQTVSQDVLVLTSWLLKKSAMSVRDTDVRSNIEKRESFSMCKKDNHVMRTLASMGISENRGFDKKKQERAYDVLDEMISALSNLNGLNVAERNFENNL